MRHSNLRAAAAMLALFAGSLAWADQHIYVSTAGNDQAAGTQAAPLLTIQKAVEQARQLPGTDTVYIHIASGTYQLDAPITLTERDTRPIVFEGDAGDMPVISGGYRIGGWEQSADGVWTATTSQARKPFEQLFVNDERATLARTPDKGLFEVIGRVQQTTLDEGNKEKGVGLYSQRYATKPENLETLKSGALKSWTMANAQDNRVRIKLYQAWDNTYKYVDYVSPDSGYIYVHGQRLHDMYSRHNLFYLENYLGALNAPGEWFLTKEGKLLYIPREGEQMSAAAVYAPALEQLLVIKGQEGKPASGKVFRNLSFQHTGYTLPNNGTVPHQAATHLGGTVSIEHAEGIVLENCEVKHTGNYGVNFDHAQDCKVEHTFLYDLGGGGIKIDNSDGIQVVNNIIRKGGQVFPAGVGVILIDAAKNKVLHNDICDLRYSALSVGWVWGYGPSRSVENEIGYNYIHHLGWGELDDMGGVYTLGISPGTTVHNNVIHDVVSHDYGGWGLYTDEGSSGIVMENNLVYGCKCAGFHQHYGEDNIIRNNIFAWGIWSQLQYSCVEDHRSFTFAHNIVLADDVPFMFGVWNEEETAKWRAGKIDYEGNCYWDINNSNPPLAGVSFAEWKKTYDKKAVLADPLFKDPIHGDFTFKSLKVAKKIGFKPFDYTKAGVEGDAAWKQKAQMSAEELEDFRQVVIRLEKKLPAYYTNK